MDGWRLASEITGDTAINSARLVLMAPVGTIGADAKMKLLRWFNGYIAKPVRPVELLDALGKALSSEVDLEPAELEEATPEEPERRFPGEVLVAEDHEVNRELFSLFLGKLGCAATEARDGVEAVEIGSSRRFDIILMDIFMPRMNGYEAAKALRERGYDGPIIAVTASALKGERENCIEAGMDDVLVKPFKREDLAAVLARWMPRREALETESTLGDSASRVAAAPGATAAAPAGAAPATEVFDWAGVLDTFLGQAGTVASLVGRFIEKARGQLSDLESCLSSGDLPRFREVAHSIKGAALNLSARRLGEAAFAGEKAGAAADAAAATEALSRLRAAFAEFEAAAAPYAAARPDPSASIDKR